MAVTDTIDWVAALRTYLLDQAYVTDQVGQNVFAQQLPHDFGMPDDAVVIIPMGGVSANREPLVKPSVQLRCYGKSATTGDCTAEDAARVYRGVRSALHNVKQKRITPGTGVEDAGTHWLVISKEASHMEVTVEYDTGWVFAVGMFDMQFVQFPVT